MRAMRSMPVPGVKGTINLMGACVWVNAAGGVPYAKAGVAAKAPASKEKISWLENVRRFMF